jgi:hypothetical protein
MYLAFNFWTPGNGVFNKIGFIGQNGHLLGVVNPPWPGSRSILGPLPGHGGITTTNKPAAIGHIYNKTPMKMPKKAIS